MIGQIVTVTVDRPIGSYHPNYPNTYYPINYGYIEGTMVADGEEQDAYVLGIGEPISKFTGRVIAIIKRENDIEQKLVVAPDGVSFTKEEIEKLTFFQEKYFTSKIVLETV